MAIRDNVGLPLLPTGRTKFSLAANTLATHRAERRSCITPDVVRAITFPARSTVSFILAIEAGAFFFRTAEQRGGGDVRAIIGL